MSGGRKRRRTRETHRAPARRRRQKPAPHPTPAAGTATAGTPPGPAAATNKDPLAEAQDLLERQIPNLAAIAVRRAAQGKPASLLKAVRQMIREVATARRLAAAEARKGIPLIGKPGWEELTPFERKWIDDLRRTIWNAEPTSPAYNPDLKAAYDQRGIRPPDQRAPGLPNLPTEPMETVE